ncbi:MAG TPA: putative sulfate exporter family transporter, partial [Clostridia bacterium]|nr:putative sulfate exporter family transporter [Clostridia bacterium]
MEWIRRNAAGILASAALAWVGLQLGGLIPNHLISGSVFALLLGMALHPLTVRFPAMSSGVGFVSKNLLRLSIVLMGLTLSFSQVLSVGKYSLMVMCFTLLTAFGGGYLLGKLLGMDWKLSGLISAGTGICGGSAIAAISPVIDAKDADVAYAISATFLFDILMVVLFPIAGRAFGMTDMG